MFKARWETRIFRADAQKCAEEITEICNDIGSATPQRILEKARDESTELHKCFTWDDTIAAEKYRLAQARQVVCKLKIEIIEQKKSEPTPIRFFYKTDNSGYKPTSFIVQHVDEYQFLLERAKRELEAFKQKYKNITELEEVFEAIDNI